ERFADLDVILRLEIELARLTPSPSLDVAGLVLAVGHAVVQEIRQSERNLLELPLDERQLRFDALQLGAGRLRLLQQRRDVLALRLGPADRLRMDVAFVAQLVGAYLPFLARLLELGQARNVEYETPA